MTFNDLFEKKDLGNNVVELILNKNFVCPYFEEDFDGEDELFSMKMKSEYADKFIDNLSNNYETIEELVKYMESHYSTSYDGFTDMFFIFALRNLRTKMSLYDYYTKYKFDESITFNHLGYGLDLTIEMNGKIHGTIHIDDCTLELDQNFGLNSLRVRSYSPTFFSINLNKKSLLKEINIYFFEMV